MRVYLRRPELSDGRECLEAARRSIALHRPWVFPALSLSGWTDYVGRIETPRHEGFLICRASDDKVAGVINLNEIIRGAMDGAFVGYWAFDGMTERGYMTEGLALVFDHAFGPMDLHRLEVNVQPDNVRSIALARRLGLNREGFSPRYLRIDGEWKDHERWAMVKENWLKAGSSSGVLEQLTRNLSRK